MKNLIILFTCLFIVFVARAQYKVNFIVEDRSRISHDSVYISGSFNNWSNGDVKYLLKHIDPAHLAKTLDLPAGKLEYKFTRGDWLTVEKDAECREKENRRAEIRTDTTIKIIIDNWRDECTAESLIKKLRTEADDTNKVNTLNILCSFVSADSAIQYANEAMTLSEKLNFKKGRATAYRKLGLCYMAKANYTESRKYLLAALGIQQALQNKNEIAHAYLMIAYTYWSQDNYPEALNNTYSAIKLYQEIGDNEGLGNCYTSIGDYYSTIGDEDNALKNYFSALKFFDAMGAKGAGEFYIGSTSLNLADIYLSQNKYAEALEKDSAALAIFQDLKNDINVAASLNRIGSVLEKQGDAALQSGDIETSNHKFLEAERNYLKGKALCEKADSKYMLGYTYNLLGNLYIKLGKNGSAQKYLQESYQFYKEIQSRSGIQDAYQSLSILDSAQGNYKLSLQHYKMYILYRDSLFNQQNTKKEVATLMQYDFDKKEALAKAEQDKKDAEVQRIKTQQYFVIAALGILVLAVIVIAFIQYRNNKQKQKANLLLQHQKEEIQHQKEKVESTLSELKSTQAQLIQSEKMASLGELTAGIAHEIQNPLNFVNNFSEVNKELVDELQNELNAGNTNDAIAISKDIKENEEKILHHGKRADAIVKGMLQHSRASSGKKEPTDINALADEYVRLAYHGLRAKDKTFNATFKTDFDSSIGKINIVQQDIGRVLLNLINNAFYAVSEKKKIADENYEPTVWLSTKKENGNIIISVKDNGTGISQKVVDKIFQPFFTTKPTGQGTGLGLSLSYDIIKAHGGEIKTETEEGEGSTFIIKVPTS